MNFTKEEYNNLDLVCISRTAELRRKDDLLLKKYVYADPLVKSRFDYLLRFPHIEGSGELLEELFINNDYKGIVVDNFQDALPFSKGEAFSIEEKSKACIDINRQLLTLHNYHMCFNDIHSDNFLIDKYGGHLIDFDEIDYFEGASYSPKYRLGNCDGSVFSGSVKVDLYKALLCYLELFYNLDIVKELKFANVLDISRVPNLFSDTSIETLINDATSAMFCFDLENIPGIEELLPFIFDEERYNSDLEKIKKNIKVIR